MTRSSWCLSCWYKGEVLEPLRKFIREDPGLRINLLHFDMELYEPTKFVFKPLSTPVRGGDVVFNDTVCFHGNGEARPMEEYFEEAIGHVRVIRRRQAFHRPIEYPRVL